MKMCIHHYNAHPRVDIDIQNDAYTNQADTSAEVWSLNRNLNSHQVKCDEVAWTYNLNRNVHISNPLNVDGHKMLKIQLKLSEN